MIDLRTKKNRDWLQQMREEDNAANMMKFQEQAMRSVTTEIFAVGTWTDAGGRTASWDAEDIAKIIKNFEENKANNGVPLKVGHTRDSFNKRVADALDVPEILIRGGIDGNGQMRLGHVAKLTMEDSKLIATFEDVPLKLADLIESGAYTSVSSEMAQDDDDDSWILTAVALLGAESPAVEDLAPLSEAAIHQANSKGSWWTFNNQGEQPSGDGRPPKDWWDSCMAVASSFEGIPDAGAFCGSVFFNGEPLSRESFDTKESTIATALRINKAMSEKAMKTENSKPGKKSLVGTVLDKLRGVTQELGLDEGALTDVVLARLSEKENDEMTTKFRINEEDLPALYDALGLGEDATIEEVVGAIQAMKDALAEGDQESHDDDDEEEEMRGLDMSKAPAMIQLKKDVDALKNENAGLKRERLVAHYQTRVSSWKAVATEEDLAVELADIHQNIGEDAAEKVADHYEKTNAAQMDVTKRIGSAKKKLDDEAIPFEDAVNTYSEKNEVSFEQALVVVSKQKPDEFREYRKKINREVQEEYDGQ